MKKVTLSLALITSLSIASNAQAIWLDGNDDYVQTAYSGVLGSANRTFEAWVFVDTAAPASNLCILDYGQNVAGSRNTFLVSGTRELRFISGGTNANIGSPVGAIMNQTWTHVAFVLNNGTGYLYVNGSQVGTGSLTSVNTPAGAEAVKVGERVSGGSIPFQGRIDEVRVWNVARTPSEIQANMTAELCSTHPNLQLYLRMNEGVPFANNMGLSTATDYSGNGHDGTLNNFSLTGALSNWGSGSGVSAGFNSSNVQARACNSYSLSPGSTVYTSSGNYTEVLVGANANGCDSIVDLDLIIDTVNTGVSLNGAALTADLTGASYQWLSCPAMTPIAGASGQTHTAVSNGSYAVVITDSLCSDTSDCITVSSVGLDEAIVFNPQVYPNPNSGNFKINFGEIQGNIRLDLHNLNGQLIQSQSCASCKEMEFEMDRTAGIYLLHIQSENGQNKTIRISKL